MSIRKTKISKSFKRNAPAIFKIAGLIGLIAAPFLTVPSTVKAVRACDKRKKELGVEKLPAGEIVKTSWKYYIPVASLMGASTFSMVNGESMSNKRTAVLASAYNAAEQTLAEYREETRKRIGEKTEQEIHGQVLENQAERVKEQTKGLPIQGQENGGTLFYEPITGTFFYSTRNKIDKAFNELSAQMIRENYVDLGDLFYYLGLVKVEACNIVGWNSNRTKTIEPKYKWCGIEEECIPYTVMSYSYHPTVDFARD